MVEGISLSKVDPEIAKWVKKEEERQEFSLEMIASENHTSKAVMEAIGSVMTDKYGEGYPFKRYYAGCIYVDKAEELARERVKKLFGAEYANVQPHSGTQANMEAYSAIMEPGDPIMNLELASGGHLSQGSPVSFSGKYYNFTSYQVDKKTELLDYDKILEMAKKCKPKVIMSGYTAYPRQIDFKAFRDICDEVGARHIADISHIAGLIAGKAYSDPVPHSDIITSTTHKTLRGPRGAIILCIEELAKSIDKAVFPFSQGGPFLNNIAAKAVCFKEAMKPAFRKYAKQVIENARALAKVFDEEGFRLVSGGTDSHLILIDVMDSGISGKEAQFSLEDAKITINRNTIPYETRTPFDPSGIRIGTPAVTTRGMKEREMKQIGEMTIRVLRNIKDSKVKKEVAREVTELCRKFPIPR